MLSVSCSNISYWAVFLIFTWLFGCSSLLLFPIPPTAFLLYPSPAAFLLSSPPLLFYYPRLQPISSILFLLTSAVLLISPSLLFLPMLLFSYPPHRPSLPLLHFLYPNPWPTYPFCVCLISWFPLLLFSYFPLMHFSYTVASPATFLLLPWLLHPYIPFPTFPLLFFLTATLPLFRFQLKLNFRKTKSPPLQCVCSCIAGVNLLFMPWGLENALLICARLVLALDAEAQSTATALGSTVCWGSRDSGN